MYEGAVAQREGTPGLGFFLSFRLACVPCSRPGVKVSRGVCRCVMCRKLSVDGFSGSTAGISQSINDTLMSNRDHGRFQVNLGSLRCSAKLQGPIFYAAEADICPNCCHFTSSGNVSAQQAVLGGGFFWVFLSNKKKEMTKNTRSFPS